MCVAVRIDEAFCDRVIAALMDHDLRAVATSADVDLRRVLVHALAARRHHQRRDVTLAVIWTLTLLLVPLWAIISAFMMALVSFAARYSLMSARAPYIAMGVNWRVGLRAVGAFLACLALPVTALAITPSVTGSPWVSWLTGAFPAAALLPPLAWLVMYGIVLYYWLLDRAAIIGDRGGRSSRYMSVPVLSGHYPQLPERLDVIEAYQRGNVTVYSDSPWFGFGHHKRDWSFALPISPSRDAGLGLPGAERGKVTPFSVLDLIGHVRKRLREISRDDRVSPNGHDPLPGLRLEERVFVNGRALRNDSRFIQRRDQAPKAYLPPGDVNMIALAPRGAARHCLCAHISSWRDDITASSFLHFSTMGATLYVKCDHTVLGPVDYLYREVDRLATTALTPRHILYHAVEGIFRLFTTAFSAPRRAFRYGLGEARRDKRRELARKVALKDLAFDYGARVSVREMAVDTYYHDCFQWWDADKHLKIVEYQVVAATLDFLDDHGVDTTDFRRTQMTFLTTGVLQTGGTTVVHNQAVGPGASAAQQIRGTR